MFRSLLVPLDGSPFGEHALPAALDLTRRGGARLQLVHVHTSAVPLAADTLPSFDEKLDLQRRIDELDYLADIAGRLRGAGAPDVSTALLEEPVVTAIHNHAVASGADLIVMTTHGRGALSRFWLGSVADTLVRRTTLPVLLIRPPAVANSAPPPGFRHIIIPLDGSPLAEQIIPCATAIGDDTAHYLLLQAVGPGHASANGPAPASAPHDHAAHARDYLARVAAPLQRFGLRVSTDVITGPAGPAILRYASCHPADLIALETHGRGGVMRLLLGSVAEQVLRGASCPVLLNRPA